MRRALDRPIAAAIWPAGVAPSGFAPAQASAVHALLAIGYADGGGTVGAFDSWWPALRTDPEFDPALIFIARAGADIVGVAQCWTSAFVKDLVVHPKWRGCGIGEALLLRAFAEFRDRSAGAVDLNVLSGNAGACRLYHRLGMVAVADRNQTPDDIAVARLMP
jgi:ribosomal protein S18 acetylase RimI-like enzyme